MDVGKWGVGEVGYFKSLAEINGAGRVSNSFLSTPYYTTYIDW